MASEAKMPSCLHEKRVTFEVVEMFRGGANGLVEWCFHCGAIREIGNEHSWQIPTPLREQTERVHRIEPTCRCSYQYGLAEQCRLPAGHLAEHVTDGPLVELSIAFAFSEEARLRFEQGRKGSL